LTGNKDIPGQPPFQIRLSSSAPSTCSYKQKRDTTY